MKRAILTIAALVCAFSASAQYNTFTLDNPSIFKLIQIDQAPESTLFFFTATATKEDMAFNINDDACVKIPGDYHRYSIKSLANLTLTSQNSSVCLRNPGDQVNFVIETERIPLEKEFSFIENDAKEGELMFNFRNIKVDTSVETSPINPSDFISATDYCTTGKFYKDGDEYRYFCINDVIVATHMSWEYLGLTKSGKLRMTVSNFSGHDISFGIDNVKITANKRKNGPTEVVPIWDLPTFDSHVRDEHGYASNAYRDRVNPAATIIKDQRTFHTDRNDTATQVGLALLETLLRSGDRQAIEDYNNQLERDRQMLWDNYLQTATVGDGEEYGGFVSFKMKSYAHLDVEININGRIYRFGINNK